MRAEFFGGPLDGDVTDLIDHGGEESGFGKLVQVSIPIDAKTNRYIEAVAARPTSIVHVYRRGKTGSDGIIRLDYDGYAEVVEASVGG